MPSQPSPQRPPAIGTPHSTHDLQLLASVADHELDPATQADLDSMVATCTECAELAAELRLLAAGLADLPPEMPAPRDFRLSPEQADRARRGGLWRTLLRPFGVEGFPGLRPLAGALTALGLVGLLLTSLPLGFSAGAALPAEHSTTGNYDNGAGGAPPANSPNLVVAPQAGATTAAEAGGSGKGAPTSVPPYALQSAPTDALGVDGRSADAGTGTSGGGGGQAAPIAPSGPSAPPLSVVSTALLIAGLGLLALRLVARRIG